MLTTRLLVPTLFALSVGLAGCSGATVTLFNDGPGGADPINFYVLNVESDGPGNLVESAGERTVSVPWARTQQGQVTIEVFFEGQVQRSYNCTVWEDQNSPLQIITYFPGAERCFDNSD